MAFDVAATAYDRFMGRWSMPLAHELLAVVDPRPGQQALDVGCGPGALTGALAERLGADAVAAVDPSESFVRAARERCPGVDVRQAQAEDLPFPDASVDLCMAQLVVHFMSDPGAGFREMARVVRPRGRVAASVWDFGTPRDPLAAFWASVREVDPSAGESARSGSQDGDLERLAEGAGLVKLDSGVLTVTLRFASFQDWWDPFTLGVGPAGDHVALLDQDDRSSLRERCRVLIGPAPFEVSASAWYVVGTRPTS